jgi:hypothetical protein
MSLADARLPASNPALIILDNTDFYIPPLQSIQALACYPKIS